MITRMSLHAISIDHGWWLNILDDDKDMSRFFRGVLLKADLEVFMNEILVYTPRVSQRILGKRTLEPLDLLKLPKIPKGFCFRITYVKVGVKVGMENVTQEPPKFMAEKRRVKATNTPYTDEMPTGVYIGSSVDKRGGYARMATHEAEANADRCLNNLHYGIT